MVPTSFLEELPPAVRRLLEVTVAAFLFQIVADWFTQGWFTALFALSVNGMVAGHIWQLATYLFLHGGLWHILLNMLALVFMGPAVERAVGTRHFLILYFVSGILGGLGWLLITPIRWIPCVGASGAIFGVMAAYGALFPQRIITLLLFYVVPISMKAWQMVLLLGAVELISLMTSTRGGVAYAAHLAGGVSGYVYAMTMFRGWRQPRWLDTFRARRRRPFTPDPPARSAGETAEMDRILEKIAGQGLGSLTREEREFMERVSRRDG